MAYPYGNPPDIAGSLPLALESRYEAEPHYSSSDQNDPNFGTRITTTATSLHPPEQLAVADDLLLGSWAASSEQDYYDNVAALEDHADNPPSAPLPLTQTDQSIDDFVQQYQAEHARGVFDQADPWYPGHRLGADDQPHPQYTGESIAPYFNQNVGTDDAPHPPASLLEVEEPHHPSTSNGAETLDGSTTDLENRPSDQSSKKTKTCAVCGAHFTGRYGRGNYSRHYRQQHSGQRADSKVGCTCRMCKKTFKRQDARRKHEWRQHQLLDAKPCPRREAYTGGPETSTAGIDVDLTGSEVSFDTRTLPSDSDFVHLGTQADVCFQTPVFHPNPYDIFTAMGEVSVEQHPPGTHRPTAQLENKDKLLTGSVRAEGLSDHHRDTEQDADYKSIGHAVLEDGPAGGYERIELRRQSQHFTFADQPANFLTPARPVQTMAHHSYSDSRTTSSNGGYTGSYFNPGIGSEYPSYFGSPNTSMSSALNHNESPNHVLLLGQGLKLSGPFSDRFSDQEDASAHNNLNLNPQVLQYFSSSMLELPSEHDDSSFYNAP